MKDGIGLALPEDAWLEELVRRSLAEDIGPGDVSTELAVASGQRARATLVGRSGGVLAGLALVEMVYRQLGGRLQFVARLRDGAVIESGTVIADLEGSARVLLTGERTALNFLQHLSGIASLTARYVAAVAGTNCRILDTRKTLPGYRALAKYAVRAGGGQNHRLGLYDRVMLKDNHWATTRADLAALVQQVRLRHPRLAVEIEVDSLEQLRDVLPLGVEWILLDNFTPAQVAEAVQMRRKLDAVKATALEASGNIDLGNVRAYALAGVDAVSIGRLTHSAPALDIGMDVVPLAREPAKGTP
jgi:nicotinate-nucleotide pyrophosphorylase (carboxylating)